MAKTKYSLIIPVYKNAGSVPVLLQDLNKLNQHFKSYLEVVFVVDGSPDQSWATLKRLLPGQHFPSKLILLSRNFGSFAAIKTGLAAGSGAYFAIMAADLQEPISLAKKFFKTLEFKPVDVAIGVREKRYDGTLSLLSANIFWFLYRRFIQKEMPIGGIDIFGCNLTVRDLLLKLPESNSSLVGLLLWLGFRRSFVPYTRKRRHWGKSGWTLSRKIRYVLDSALAFSDLPIYAFFTLGVFGILTALILASAVIFAKITGNTSIPGYTATISIMAFFSGIHFLGLGILGSYIWRTFENTKNRPAAIIMSQHSYPGKLK